MMGNPFDNFRKKLAEDSARIDQEHRDRLRKMEEDFDNARRASEQRQQQYQQFRQGPGTLGAKPTKVEAIRNDDGSYTIPI